MSDVSGTETPEAAIEAEPTEEVAPDPHALDDLHTELVERFGNELGVAVLDQAAVFGMPVVRVRRIDWRSAAEVAKGALDCDYLSFIAGIDWMPSPKESGDEGASDTSAPVQPQETTYGAAGSDGRFQVFARVQSTSRHWGLTLKTDVDEHAMRVDSWTPVYPGADWHERETWEMYGIEFAGHPALRHLYLPSEFEGHPLRKDYPLLAREVKPWPGLVDVEGMPGEEGDGDDESAGEG